MANVLTHVKNPYKTKDTEIYRFRGLFHDMMGAEIPMEFVGDLLNAVSYKIGSHEARHGTVPTDQIDDAGSLLGACDDEIGRAIAGNSRLYFERRFIPTVSHQFNWSGIDIVPFYFDLTTNEIPHLSGSYDSDSDDDDNIFILFLPSATKNEHYFTLKLDSNYAVSGNAIAVTITAYKKLDGSIDTDYDGRHLRLKIGKSTWSNELPDTSPSLNSSKILNDAGASVNLNDDSKWSSGVYNENVVLTLDDTTINAVRFILQNDMGKTYAQSNWLPVPNPVFKERLAVLGTSLPLTTKKTFFQYQDYFDALFAGYHDPNDNYEGGASAPQTVEDVHTTDFYSRDLSCTKSDASVVLFKKNNTRLNEYWTDNYAGIGIWHMMHLIQRHCWKTKTDSVGIGWPTEGMNTWARRWYDSDPDYATALANCETNIDTTSPLPQRTATIEKFTAIQRQSGTLRYFCQAIQNSCSVSVDVKTYATQYTCDFYGYFSKTTIRERDMVWNIHILDEFDNQGITAIWGGNVYIKIADISELTRDDSAFIDSNIIDNHDFPEEWWEDALTMEGGEKREVGFGMTNPFALLTWDFEI